MGPLASTPSSSSRIAARFAAGAKLASAAVVAIAALVLVGWLLRIPTLVQLVPGLASMKPNTALALGMLGIALRLSIDPRAGDRSGGRGRAGHVARGLAIAAAAIGAATVLEYAAHVDLGIDHLIAREAIDTAVPDRMSPGTAVCILALGTAVLRLASPWAGRLGLAVALSAHVALLGYLFGVRDLYAIGAYASVALHTAIAIYALAAGVVFALPRPRGLVHLLASDSPGGVLARRLVPAVLMIPAAIALLRQWGERAGLYGPGFGRAMLVASNTVILIALIGWTAAALARADAQRRATEAAAELATERARADLVRSGDRLRTLAQVSDAFAAVVTSYQPLLDRIARAVADLVGDGCIVALISDDGEQLHAAANAHRDPALDQAFKQHLSGVSVLRMTSTSVAITVARTGQPIRADVEPAVVAAQADEAFRPLFSHVGVHGLAVVPIRARGNVIGTLSVLRNESGRAYTEDDVTLLADLADRAGLAIDNARLYAQLEQRVNERTAELESANHELESFSYSVAHDLRAPLRAISGFSHALIEDVGDRFETEDMRHATQIRDAARRMGELIDALLDLARISRTEPRRRWVDVSAVARSVIATLREAQPERNVEVVIADGLTAHADPRLLEVVLTNLIGNAWKFTGKRDAARIEIAALPGDRPTVYVVRDNGAGFDSRHASKLFGVFQRLHTAADFEGTGIGLATVQRIVRRHGGLIWAEAELDRGAAFYFALQPPPRSK